MLWIDRSHPRFASLFQRAKAEGIPIQELDANEDVPISALQRIGTRLLLATDYAIACSALRRWARMPSRQRVDAIVWLGASTTDDEMITAWQEDIAPRPMLTLDRNLEEHEVWLDTLAWGAVVPWMQSIQRQEQESFLGRIKKAAQGAKALVLPADQEAAWRIHSSSSLENLGGWMDARGTNGPGWLHDRVTDAHGLSQGVATSPTHWVPVFENDVDHVLLTGKGPALVNGVPTAVHAAEQWIVQRHGVGQVRYVGDGIPSPGPIAGGKPRAS